PTATWSRPGSRPERGAEPELARVEDADRIERVLDRLKDPEPRAERVGQEPPAVETDPVVVADRRTVCEDRSRRGVPRPAVVGLLPRQLGLVTTLIGIGPAPGEGEVDARAGG